MADQTEMTSGPALCQPLPSRREVLSRIGTGLPMLGLATVMAQNGLVAPARGSAANPLTPRAPHFAPRAKRVIHLFLNGGPSHLDTFDPKPLLKEYEGKALPTPNLRTERPTGGAYPSPWAFRKYGQSGIEVSDLFPHVAQHIDDICVIRSMHANVPNHEPSLMLMNCGESLLVRPSFGSWLTYGLGTENQNMPGFVVLCPGGYPIKGAQNWQSAFLPGIYQGTHIDPKNRGPTQVLDHIRNSKLSMAEQRRQLDLIDQLNRKHLAQRGSDPGLEARIQSYELAYRMQIEATDAFDISQEPAWVHERYGTAKNPWARYALMVRRLIERGVRFVQLWHGDGQPWDSHDHIAKEHGRLAGQSDQPVAALLSDLKERGLLEETLVLWGGEFGRTPTVELAKAGSNAGTLSGRDHNHHGFTCWLAGGGVRGGHVHGSTDDFGWKAAEKPVHVHDLHATMLHLLGFDHTRLTYRYAGRDFRLTDVHGEVVREVIA